MSATLNFPAEYGQPDHKGYIGVVELAPSARLAEGRWQVPLQLTTAKRSSSFPRRTPVHGRVHMCERAGPGAGSRPCLAASFFSTLCVPHVFHRPFTVFHRLPPSVLPSFHRPTGEEFLLAASFFSTWRQDRNERQAFSFSSSAFLLKRGDPA